MIEERYLGLAHVKREGRVIRWEDGLDPLWTIMWTWHGKMYVAWRDSLVRDIPKSFYRRTGGFIRNNRTLEVYDVTRGKRHAPRPDCSP